MKAEDAIERLEMGEPAPICALVREQEEAIERLRKVEKECELRREQMSRFPFCSDHRDKQHGLSCRACEIERLNTLAQRLARALDELLAQNGQTCSLLARADVQPYLQG